jgi:hypothetical protein
MAWLVATRHSAGSAAPETAITAGAGRLSRGRSRRDKKEPGPVRKTPEQTHGVESVVLEFVTIGVGGHGKVLDQRFQRIEPLRFVTGARVIVEHDHLGVRSVKVMPSDFGADEIRHGDASFLTDDVMNALDVGRVAPAVPVADDEMLFG